VASATGGVRISAVITVKTEEDAVRVRGYPAGVPCWTTLCTPDPAASARFYADLLGWDCDGEVFRSAGLARAGLRAPADTPPGWLAFIASDDVDATVADALAAGATLLEPPHPASPGGRAAVLRDAVGATVGVWQPAGFAGAQVAAEPGTACWVDLATGDLTGAEAFYGRTFGWSTKAYGYALPDSGYLEWVAGDRTVAGLRPVPAQVPPHWLVTFEVADIGQALATATAAGAQPLYGPVPVTVGVYAQILDPQGASCGLFELAPELRQLR
jgi:predicted enzyme related to lactoylglutathione lyase